MRILQRLPRKTTAPGAQTNIYLIVTESFGKYPKNYSLKHKINRNKQNKKKVGTIIKAAVKSMSKSIISCPSALIKKIVFHIQKAKSMPEEI